MSNEANGLIILGNGFDLGLGLKTGYADFIQYLNNQVLSDNRRDKNPLIERIVKDGSLGGKWVDLEMLLLSYANSRFEFLNFNNLNEVRDELAKFLLEEQRRLVIRKSNPVHFLNKTTTTVNSVINLNYTNSIDALIGSSFVIRKGHFISEVKIHGSLNNNNLILGFDQSAKIHSDYSQFKKSFFENYNPIDFIRLLSSIENVYLYGVSMGESDDFFFNNLFQRIEAIGGKKVFISYHGQEGKTRLNGRLDVFLSGRMAQFKLLNQIVLFDTEKAPDEWNW